MYTEKIIAERLSDLNISCLSKAIALKYRGSLYQPINSIPIILFTLFILLNLLSAGKALPVFSEEINSQGVSMQNTTVYSISGSSTFIEQCPEEVVGFDIQLDLLYSKPDVLVDQIEKCFKQFDLNNSDFWYFFVIRYIFITQHPSLLRATGCSSEWDYMHQCGAMLGISILKIREMLDRYRIYKNYEPVMISYDLRAHDKSSKLFAPGMYEKLGLLDLANKVKRNQLGKLYSESDVFRHFIEDDLRAFKEYIDPSIVREEKFKAQYKQLRSQIKSKSKGHEEVHLLCLPAGDSSLKERVQAIISRTIEEAKYE